MRLLIVLFILLCTTRLSVRAAPAPFNCSQHTWSAQVAPYILNYVSTGYVVSECPCFVITDEDVNIRFNYNTFYYSGGQSCPQGILVQPGALNTILDAPILVNMSIAVYGDNTTINNPYIQQSAATGIVINSDDNKILGAVIQIKGSPTYSEVYGISVNGSGNEITETTEITVAGAKYAAGIRMQGTVNSISVVQSLTVTSSTDVAVGIQLSGCHGCSVEGVTMEAVTAGNSSSAVAPHAYGILLQGGSDNIVHNLTMDSLVITGGKGGGNVSSGGNAYGIYLNGSSSNTISNLELSTHLTRCSLVVNSAGYRTQAALLVLQQSHHNKFGDFVVNPNSAVSVASGNTLSNSIGFFLLATGSQDNVVSPNAEGYFLIGTHYWAGVGFSLFDVHGIVVTSINLAAVSAYANISGSSNISMAYLSVSPLSSNPTFPGSTAIVCTDLSGLPSNISTSGACFSTSNQFGNCCLSYKTQPANFVCNTTGCSRYTCDDVAICRFALALRNTPCAAANPSQCRNTSLCNGYSEICPPQGPLPSSTICRSAGGCVQEQRCDGTSTVCGAISYQPAGFNCTSYQDCQLPGVCLSGGACSAPTLLNASSICYKDICGNPPIYCKGNNATCPKESAKQCQCISGGCCDLSTNLYRSPGFTCQNATPCAAASTCSGGSETCPAPVSIAGPCCDSGQSKPTSYVCRYANTTLNPCDADDHCTGTSPDCPDTVASPFTICYKPKQDQDPLCFLSFGCDGVNKSCPIGNTSNQCGGDVGGYCGDTVCQDNENCSSCRVDCLASCPILTCPNCTHGTCVNGVCECDANYTGPTCSKEIQPIIVQPNITITVNTTTADNFQIQVLQIAEIDQSGNVVDAINISQIQFQAVTEYLPTAQRVNLTANLFNSVQSVLRVSVYVFNDSTTIDFAGRNYSYSANSIKNAVEISGWPFKVVTNRLALEFLVTSSEPCQGTPSFQQDDSQNIYYFAVNGGSNTLFCQLVQDSIVDDRIVQSTFKVNDTNRLLIIVPHFWVYAAVDPSYSVLIGDDNQRNTGCNADVGPVAASNFKMILVIAIVVPVAAALVMAGLVFAIVKPKVQTWWKLRHTTEPQKEDLGEAKLSTPKRPKSHGNRQNAMYKVESSDPMSVSASDADSAL